MSACKAKKFLELPVLPLRDVVVFPHMVIPLFVGRAKSVTALEIAMQGGKSILLIAQKDASQDNPTVNDIFNTGTIASILQLLKMPDGTVKVLVEGERRARILHYTHDVNNPKDCFMCEVELVNDTNIYSKESDILLRTVTAEFENYVKLNSKIPPEILTSLSGIEDVGRVADTIAAHLNLKNEEKQAILELLDANERLEHILGVIDSEIDLLQVENKIRARVKKQMGKSQREYYLNEQMKAIQNELGDLEEGINENDEIAKKIAKSGMSEEAMEKAENELKKLKMMSPMSAEATVVRNYVDWLLALPWKTGTRISRDIAKSQKVLDDDHYGLEKVKDRILEYLAVQKRVKKSKAAILCLVGPPGVGKTSLGESIARATNRKFIRMSLGGVRDEAEIRGHRRTYIGSMPGKIIQNLAKAKTNNPLFMLDEVDKMSMDFRGDPSSALLEVLDPEQNHKFGDHYMEVDYDLSDVMFITTANTLNIPNPLLDRMEVIRISGYTDEEKLEIAHRYLVPKQRKNNGLKASEVSLSNASIKAIISSYTREAGVRNLEREISKIYRKVVKELLLHKTSAKVSVTPKYLEKYLGAKRFRRNATEKENKAGQVSGLAWTEFGGELLTIEAAVMPGKGERVYTGKLGEVMQESIVAAISVVRSRSRQWGINQDFYEKEDIHVHVPEGATPKDGPSAGIGMCTAIVSALTGVPALSTVAMTGEITLRGEVLPIGGLKEKLLAAHRAGIKRVIIPHENTRDLPEIPEKIRQDLEIKSVQWIDEVIELALERVPKPAAEKDISDAQRANDNKPSKSDDAQSGLTAH
ncbi:endopeptidase La [Candidatus Spongiihabitans sp.]|uniref:endopeptidase La n=1 Tax=Candidatus Spongiihabitans sp. TaxID=3101308 RepID=UPI003C7A422B